MKSVVGVFALVVVAASAVTAGAVSAEPALYHATALVFEADGLDGTAGTAVVVAGQAVATLTDNIEDFAEVRVDLPSHLLHSGRLDVRLDAGWQASDGLDEFAVRAVRLDLGGGIVAIDPRYDAERAYRIGDGVDADAAWGAPAARLPNADRLGHLPGLETVLEVRSPLIASRTFRFELPDPAGSAPGANAASLTAATAGAAFAKPHDPAPGLTEVVLEPADAAAVAVADGTALETVTEQGFASQEFTYVVNEAAAGATHLRVTWQGRTPPGRGATLYAWDRIAGLWADVASVADAAEGATLTATLDTTALVDDTGVLRLLVQERRYDDADTDFAFAWITDTQFYAERYADTYDAMNEWIVANAAAQRIVYGVHTGDITQNYNGAPIEWQRASDSMAILEAGDMPYGITTGNHDLYPDGSRDALLYDRFFPASRFADMATEHVRYGGGFRENQNHYDLIEVGDARLLALYLGHGTDDADVAWANQVLAAHPDHHVIVALHQYISPTAEYGSAGQRVFNEVVAPNANVFLVLCGHYTGSVYNVRRIPTPDGRQRITYEVLHDYQGGDDGGNGYLKLLRFDLDAQQLDLWSYSPIVDDFDNAGDITTDADRIAETDDDVTLALDLAPIDRRLATDYVAVTR